MAFNKKEKTGYLIVDEQDREATIVALKSKGGPAIEIPALTKNGKIRFDVDDMSAFERMIVRLKAAGIKADQALSDGE